MQILGPQPKKFSFNQSRMGGPRVFYLLVLQVILVHGQGGGLPEGLAAGAAGVGLAVCVHHVVLIQA